MARTSQQTTTHNGFAIPLLPDTDLGLAMLIAESEDGQHEPVAVVGAEQAIEHFAREYGGVPDIRNLEAGHQFESL
jgi:hypothetical protein